MTTTRITQPSPPIAPGRRTRLVSDGVVARYLHDISTRDASPAPRGDAPQGRSASSSTS